MKWEEEFVQLYTSTDLEKGREAFALKRKYIPAKLYRYRTVSKETLEYRKLEIVNGELFLSHPDKMNDPFECWSVLHNTSPESYVDKFTYIDYYVKNGKTEELKVIMENDNWFEALKCLQSSKSKSREEEKCINNAINDSIMFAMEDINKEIRKRITQMIRFACFTTTATNLPMWYHYTDGRKGFCLEYSTEAITDRYQLDSLFPVQYVGQLPDMTYMLAHRDSITLSMPTYLSFHKLNDWAYEKEWRLIYDSGFWLRKGTPLPEGFEKEGVTINFIKPSKVILGTDIEPEFEEEIAKCAQSAGIKVVKSKLTEYGLSVD